MVPRWDFPGFSCSSLLNRFFSRVCPIISADCKDNYGGFSGVCDKGAYLHALQAKATSNRGYSPP